MITQSLLFSTRPLVISPDLAVKIGLNEAIVLQQLHYWIQKSKHDHEGKIWAYNTINDWHDQFPFFSVNTIRRTFDNLVKSKLVLKGCFNKLKMDKTTWYAIDYMQLTLLQNGEDAHSNAFTQNEQMDRSNWANGITQNEQMDSPKMSKAIPEITRDYSETTSDIAAQPKKCKFDPINFKPKNVNPELWQDWINHRKELKKPLTETACKRLKTQLEAMADPEAAIELSITRGYQGVFDKPANANHGNIYAKQDIREIPKAYKKNDGSLMRDAATMPLNNLDNLPF